MKFLLFVIPSLLASNTNVASDANPIGQVLKLLEKLYNTVVQDGEVEQKQFEEFADWCSDQAAERQREIKAGKAEKEDHTATIEKATADHEVYTSKIAELSESISSIEADAKEATRIRESEHATYVKEEKELVETVDTLRRAINVLKKAMQGGGSFAQMPSEFNKLITSLSAIVDSAVLSTQNMSEVQAFLQAGEEGVNAPGVQAYESKSGGIVDTLTDLLEKAENTLAEARKAETKALHSYELLTQSFANEVKVQNDALSSTKKQLAATAEVKATAEGDLSVTIKDVNEDEVYLKDLAQNCQQRAVDADASQKERAEELKALQEARKIIEEATGGASKRQGYDFLQLKSSSEDDLAVYQKVEKSIKDMGKNQHNAILVQLAGKIRAAVSMNSDPFVKVKGMIQDMISRLVQEAEQEASQKAFCDKEMSANDAKRKKLEAEESKLSTRLEKAVSGVATLREQIADLNSAMAKGAKSQKEIDTLRTAEHEEYLKAKADFEQGLQGVRTALKVLKDYYQKAGDSFLQALTKNRSGSKGDAAGSIISILEIAESDFARSLAEGQAAEDDALEVYERTTQDNKVSTATKKTAVEQKTQESARLEQVITDATGDRNGVQEELSAVMEYVEKLRPQCVKEPESYEDRKARREKEIEGLKTALEVLENETAFVQERGFMSRPQMTIQ